MAGIGFELKKLFHRRGLMAMLRAYGYAGVICAGPMLLGVLLQFGVLIVSSWWQVGRPDRDLLVCMITYTLLASLVLTSFLSMPVTRFLADMLFDHDEKMILPSFWGSTGIMLVVGAVLYTVFLLFSGATLMQGALCLWLFLEMIVNWNAMSYLTAIKDYKSILYSFAAAVLVAFVTSCVLLALACPPVESLLFAVVLGYGVMLVWDVLLLHRYFPQSREHPWLFLQWVDQFLPLALTGLLTTIGLFAHLVITWCGPLGIKVKGLFYGAPYYDVPAMLAFLTILITTVNFVVSVEVNFYPTYRSYYSLLNDGGTVKDITVAENEMLAVLNREIALHGVEAIVGDRCRDFVGKNSAERASFRIQRCDARIFSCAMRRICAVCGRQYHNADSAVFYRLFRCVDGVGIVCGFDGCVHSNRTVLHYVAVRFRFSDGSVAVRYLCDIPARLIHRQSAIPSAGAAADCGANETWTFHRTGHTV